MKSLALVLTAFGLTLCAADFQPLNVSIERVQQGTNLVWTISSAAKGVESIRVEEVGSNVVATIRMNPRTRVQLSAVTNSPNMRTRETGFSASLPAQVLRARSARSAPPWPAEPPGSFMPPPGLPTTATAGWAYIEAVARREPPAVDRSIEAARAQVLMDGESDVIVYGARVPINATSAQETKPQLQRAFERAQEQGRKKSR